MQRPKSNISVITRKICLVCLFIFKISLFAVSQDKTYISSDLSGIIRAYTQLESKSKSIGKDGCAITRFVLSHRLEIVSVNKKGSQIILCDTIVSDLTAVEDINKKAAEFDSENQIDGQAYYLNEDLICFGFGGDKSEMGIIDIATKKMILQSIILFDQNSKTLLYRYNLYESGSRLAPLELFTFDIENRKENEIDLSFISAYTPTDFYLSSDNNYVFIRIFEKKTKEPGVAVYQMKDDQFQPLTIKMCQYFKHQENTGMLTYIYNADIKRLNLINDQNGKLSAEAVKFVKKEATFASLKYYNTFRDESVRFNPCGDKLLVYHYDAKNYRKDNYIINLNDGTICKPVHISVKSENSYWINDSILFTGGHTFVLVGKNIYGDIYGLDGGVIVNTGIYIYNNLAISKTEANISKYVAVSKVLFTPNIENWSYPGKDSLGDHFFLAPVFENRGASKIPGKFIGYHGSDLVIFRDSLSVYRLETIKKLLEFSPAEDILADKIPNDYMYYRIDKFVPADSISKSAAFVFKNVVSIKDSVSVKFHIIDSAGNYYFAAGPGNKIICGLSYKNSKGSVQQVDDFSFTEHTTQNHGKVAVMAVIDQSGSMGDLRCRVLQKGALDLIKRKRSCDAFGLIKYDESIGLELPPDSSEKKLTKRFQISGIIGYGGYTAMLDAASFAIDALNKTKNYTSKSIILFTDGYDNSSRINKDELIRKAIENDIQINTVGYGYMIQEELLMSIAYNTGGSFSRIYRESDLAWITGDIYNKMLNYYEVTFPLEEEGKYAAFLKGCITKKSDTLLVGFDHNWEYKQNLTAKSEFGVPSVLLSQKRDKNIAQKYFSKKPLPDLDSLVSADRDNLNFYVKNDFYHIRFPDIKFVTDKTVIIEGTDEGMEDVLVFMQKYENAVIEISGHTDDRMSNEYNADLSDRRAKSVKELLTNQGVNPERILTVGFGETKPIASNSTEEGRQKNRRVEFRVIRL